MAIEFRCTQCNKLLRTGEGTAGKQAKCPECGAISTVPAAGTALPGEPPPSEPKAPPPVDEAGSPFAPGGPQPAPFDPENPYAAPGEYTPAAPSYVPAPGALGHTIIDFGDVFSRTWAIFKEQWGMCLVAVIIVGAINLVVRGAVMALSIGVQASGGDEAIGFIVVQLVSICASLFLLWFNIGLSLFFLKTARGQHAELGDILAGGPYYLRILGASILFGLICLVGYILCIVPGVIFALMFSQYYFLILDRNVGVMDSLNISKEIMTGNKLMLFAIGLVAGLVGLVIAVCTCGIGLLVVVPYLALLNPVIYLAITGQRTADQMLPRQPPAP